jgi:hypothetical protein
VNPVDGLTGAWSGLGLIVAGKREAAGFFTPTFAGLFIALVWFALALILSAAAQSMAVGLPSVAQLVVGFVIQGTTVAVLAVATATTISFLKLEASVLEVLVPIVYFMGLMQVLAIPLILLGPNVQLIAVFVLGLLIWRTATVLGGMRTTTALAFALLCLLVLVAVPNALYMLLTAFSSPA